MSKRSLFLQHCAQVTFILPSAAVLMLGLCLASCKREAKVEALAVNDSVGSSNATGAVSSGTRSTPPIGESLLRSAPADALGYMKVVHSATLKDESTSAVCKEDLSSGFGWNQFLDGAELVHSRVTFAANRGYDSWEYHFYYRDGRPLVARLRVTDWKATDQVATSDAIDERIFVFEGDQPRECLSARITTPADLKEQALEGAARSAMPCTDGPRLLAMAKAAQGPLKDPSWLKQQCEIKDPSAEILAEIRRDRAASGK
jgi:hypothetical protein